MRAAAYARYSTDNQTENSIAYQLEKITAYCSDNNITLTKFFIDEAQTGTNMERAGFLDMLAAARRHEFEAIVIYDISRGSRDVGDWFNFRKLMAALNVKIISCTQKLGDIYNSNDFLVELISVGLGQREVLETRQKSMDGVKAAAHQGKFLGGIAPLGYDIADGKYVVNSEEAKIVRKIFAMYANGDSYDQIIKALSGTKGKRGRPLSKNGLSVILRNERYIGTYFWNKKKNKLFRKWAGGKANPDVIRIEHCIPAIITLEIWEACQMRLKNNKRNSVNKAKREYLLSGLIECSSCGAAYVGHTSTKKKSNGQIYEAKSYICSNKYRNRTCKSKNVNANELETFVVAHLTEYLRTADFKQIAAYIADSVNSKIADVSAEKKELLAIDEKIKNGINAVLSGADIPELKDEIGRLRVRKSELTDIIANAEINKRQVSPAAIEKMFVAACNDIKNAANIKAVVNAFVSKIYVNPDGSCTVLVGVSLPKINTPVPTTETGVHIDNCGGTQPSLCTLWSVRHKKFNGNYIVLQSFTYQSA